MLEQDQAARLGIRGAARGPDSSINRQSGHWWALPLVLLLLVAGALDARAEPSLAEMVERLDKTQEQFVKDELTAQVPSMFSRESDREFAGELISEVRTFGRHADEIRNGNYMGIGNTLAGRTAGWVEDKIKERYPDPSSMVRQVTSSVRKYPDLYKRMGQAALNPDRHDWQQTSREVMGDYARQRMGELQAQGVNAWKDMARQVISPPEGLSKLGVDPVDMYVQGVRNWSDFLRQTGGRYHRVVLNCYHKQYTRFRAEGATAHEAKDDIAIQQLKNANCGGKGGGSLTQRAVNWAKNLFGGAATLGNFDLSPAEIAALLDEYERTGGGKTGTDFADWFEDRFDDNLKDRKKRVREAIDEEQRKEMADEDARRRAVAAKMEQALADALRKALGEDGKPVAGSAPPARPPVEEKPVEEAKDEKPPAVVTGKPGDEPGEGEPPKPDPKVAACDALKQEYAAAFSRAQPLYDAGRFKEAIGILGAMKAKLARENGSPPCIADTSRIDQGIAKSEKLDAGFGKTQQAIASCDAAKMASYSRQMKALSSPHPMMAAKIAELDRLGAKVTAVSTAFERANSAYKQGNLAQAKSGLAKARAEIAKLNGNPVCPDLRTRIGNGLDKIANLENGLGRTDQAIKSCSLDYLNKWLAKYGANPQHVLIRNRIAGVRAAKAACEEKKAEADKVAQANSDCIAKFGAGYRAGNPVGDGSYYCIPSKQVASNWCNNNNSGSGWVARNIKADGSFDCGLTKAGRNADCQRQYGSGWYAGRVQRDGSYNCHMGKSARNASCRQQYGRGWYAGKIRRDGSFLCHGPSQPTGGPSNAEVGAAIAGAIINGIISSQGGGGGGGSSNCHRRPDGTLHCGSN